MMITTKIEKMRSTGRGIAGTYENIAHHATGVEVFVKALEPIVPHLGFKIWRQGHNVHEFETTAGSRYTMRPVYKEVNGSREYTGIALSLRVSRSQEYPLTHCTRITDIPRLVEMLRMLAKPKIGKINGALTEE